MTTATVPSTTASQVTDLLAEASRLGFTVEARTHGTDYVVSVETTFAPNDTVAYVTAEADSYSLLRMVPTVTYGSTWGSDSASVGGHAALVSGQFHMCKSGVGRRFGKALVKAQGR